MTWDDYETLLEQFEGSPRYLKGWAYRITATARNGGCVNPQQLAIAKKTVAFIEQEGL